MHLEQMSIKIVTPPPSKYNKVKLTVKSSLIMRIMKMNWFTILIIAPRRRATSHLEQAPERLDNEQAASARSTSDANQKPAPLRKSQSGVATLGRLRVAPSPQQGGSVVESPATPELERPRRRQPSAARSSRSGVRDQSLTQFAVIDDENVSQQVGHLCFYYFIFRIV